MMRHDPHLEQLLDGMRQSSQRLDTIRAELDLALMRVELAAQACEPADVAALARSNTEIAATLARAASMNLETWQLWNDQVVQHAGEQLAGRVGAPC